MDPIDQHLHWEFTAFDDDPEAPIIRWAITVNVIGFACESDAIDAARGIVKRAHFRLHRVFECTTCKYQRLQTEALRDVADKA